MPKIPIQPWQDEEIKERVMAKFREVGLNPNQLLDDWSLDGDGFLKATAVVKMTPEEAAAIINGPRRSHD